MNVFNFIVYCLFHIGTLGSSSIENKQKPRADWGENAMFWDDINKLSNKTATSAGFQVSLISIFLTLLYNISICFDTKSMSSLKEARQQVVLNNFDGDIDDEELLLLFEINKSDILDLPFKNYENFDLDLLEDDECLLEFRFHKRDIPLLAEALQIPESITCYQRSVCDGVETLCIVLKCLAYPCRYLDLIPRFARAVPVLCLINNHLVDFIYETHRHRLLQWNQ